LPLDPNVATPEAELAAALEEAAAGLPVVIWKRSVPRASSTALLAASDAVIALPRADGTALPQIQGALLGLPVVAAATGASLELWPEGRDWLVPCDRRRIGRNAGRLPGGTEWMEPRIDAAAAAIREIVERRDEATARARQDAERVRALHEPAAAARRLATALESARRRAFDLKR
jgi:glycosyltransferase involved in cell wall biosynthesis